MLPAARCWVHLPCASSMRAVPASPSKATPSFGKLACWFPACRSYIVNSAPVSSTIGHRTSRQDKDRTGGVLPAASYQTSASIIYHTFHPDSTGSKHPVWIRIGSDPRQMSICACAGLVGLVGPSTDLDHGIALKACARWLMVIT